MARKCKCKVCKAELMTDIAFKVTHNGKNSYYCSESEYIAERKEIESYKNLLSYISIEVLGYEEKQIIPPVLTKKINELRESYKDEVIYQCFKDNADNIKYWLTVKDFRNEFGMASYIMAIINSKINDTYKEWKENQKRLMQQNKEVDDIDISVMNTSNNYKAKTEKSIANFLEEGDI